MSSALRLSSQVTTLCLEFVAPLLLGWWLDGKLGWSPVLTLLGMALGAALSVLGLARLSNELNRPR